MAHPVLAPGREAPITGISSMATRQLLAELAAAYTRRSGQPVVLESAGGVDVAKRIESGEPFDFVVLAAQALAALADLGRIDRASCVDLARSRIAMAVRYRNTASRHHERGCRAGGRARRARHRVLDGPERSPPRAACSSAGALPARACRASSKRHRAFPSPRCSRAVTRQIGFQQLSELIGAPGVDVVGVLPASIQQVTVFAAGVCVASTRQAAARALLEFCASPASDAAKRRHGMEP